MCDVTSGNIHLTELNGETPLFSTESTVFDVMGKPSTTDRRTYLKGLLGATALAGGVATTAGGQIPAALHEDDDDDRQKRDHPRARPLLCDISAPMGFDTVMHFDGDPAFPGEDPVSEDDHDDYPDPDKPRDEVIHVTSEGDRTSDYAASLVNIRKRTNRRVNLRHVERGSLSYDYFQGPKHRTAAPDEVFLVLQTPKQRKRNKGVALFKTINDGRSPPKKRRKGKWRTVDVVDEMTSGDWRSIKISEDPEDLVRGGKGETIGEAVERIAANLRDKKRTFSNVVRKFGKNAELVGVGVGVGNTRRKRKVDIYYDNLVLDLRRSGGGQGQKKNKFFRFNFPAVFPMELSFSSSDSGNKRTARLDPTQDEVGIDLNNLIRDSITLFAFSEAAPPLEEGVTARGSDVDINLGGYTVDFDTDEIRDLPNLAGNGKQIVLVAGRLDRDQVVWFMGQGRVRL